MNTKLPCRTFVLVLSDNGARARNRLRVPLRDLGTLDYIQRAQWLPRFASFRGAR